MRTKTVGIGAAVIISVGLISALVIREAISTRDEPEELEAL